MEVDAYLDDLTHARKADVLRIRAAILEADPSLSESIKWNAPNFVFNGEDRVTFRLQPKDRVDLVLHRGARRRDDTDSFHFDDPSALITWATPDRGVISFPQGESVEALLPRVLVALHAWVRT